MHMIARVDGALNEDDIMEPDCYIIIYPNSSIEQYYIGNLIELNREWAGPYGHRVSVEMNINPDDDAMDMVAQALTRARMQRQEKIVNVEEKNEQDEGEKMSLKIKKDITVSIEELEQMDLDYEIESIEIILDSDEIEEWIENYGLVPFKYDNNDGILSVSITHSIIEFKPAALLISNGSDISIPYNFIENVNLVYYK